MLAASYLAAVSLGKTVHKIMTGRGYSEVLSQVYDLYGRGHRVLFQETHAFAMAETKENDVCLVEWHVGGKTHVSVAEEAFVNIAHQIASVAFAMGEHDFCVWMVQQQPDELTACVSGCS